MNINKLPNTQGYDKFWGHSEGTNASSYTSTAQFDPSAATVPYIWEWFKGKKASKVKPFDLKARAALSRHLRFHRCMTLKAIPQKIMNCGEMRAMRMHG